MRKLLLSTVLIALFSVSLIVLQFSCQEEAIAQTVSNYVLPIATTSTLGGVIPDGTTILVDANGRITAAKTNTPLPIATTSTAGGVIADGTTISIDATGKISALNNSNPKNLNKLLIYDGTSFATINYDGTNKKTISFTLPVGQQFRTMTPNGRLSPDGMTLFFEANSISGVGTFFLYSIKTDGTEFKQLGASSSQIDLLDIR